MKNKEFLAAFQLSKLIIFEVHYYTLGSNKTPYFATSAEKFCKNKQDFQQCGQAQKTLLRGYPTAIHFFEKWDACHLHDLSTQQYQAMRADLETLRAKYNCLFWELDENQQPYSPHFSLLLLAEFSKQEPKRTIKIKEA